MSHPNTHTARALHSRLLIGLSVLGLTIASAILIQQALAQSTSPALRPPYHLNRTPQIAPAILILPNLALNGSILVSETFDSSYAPTTTLSATGWHQVTGTLATSGYTWGRVNSGPHPDSAWAAATSLNGDPILDPATDSYTKGMESLLIYGPIDLTNYRAAVMTASYFLDSAPGDVFGVAASIDGANFDALSADSSQDPALSVTHTAIYDLRAYKQKPAVWIAFYFVSNSDDNVGLGVFVDDMVLRAVPLVKTYLPIVALQKPTPTPTPNPTSTPTPTSTPVQGTIVDHYTFGNGLNTNSEYLTWGGQQTYSCGSSCTVIQNISTNGNPNGAINFSAGGSGVLVGTSPNHIIPTNYELSADIMVVEGKQDARFGLIFGASSSTFYVDDGDGYVKMNPIYNFYKLDLNIDPNDETLVDAVRLQRWSGGASTNLVQRTILPAQYQRSTGQWNTIRIVRQGNAITVYVNGYPIIVNHIDSTYVGSKKYGVFLHPQAANNNSNPLKIRFDNIVVTQLP